MHWDNGNQKWLVGRFKNGSSNGSILHTPGTRTFWFWQLSMLEEQKHGDFAWFCYQDAWLYLYSCNLMQFKCCCIRIHKRLSMAQGSPGPVRFWNNGGWTKRIYQVLNKAPLRQRLRIGKSSHPTARFQWSLWDLFALFLSDMKWWSGKWRIPQNALSTYDTQGLPRRTKKYQHIFFHIFSSG